MNTLRTVVLLLIFSAVAQTTHAGPEELVWVCARERWNDTGLVVQAGQTYRVEILSMDVKDWFVEVNGLNGAEANALHTLINTVAPALKRHARAPFMALVATVDRKHAVRVQEIFTAPASGRLSLYLNDVWLAYWNNSGEARLQITEQ